MIKNFFITILLLLCFVFLSVNAHPGRTDSNGGHYNRSTGEYHYHNGEYAGREQSGSTSKIKNKPVEPQKAPTELPKQKLFIGIIKPDTTFRKGKTYEFSAKIPEGYSQDQVTWSSENKSIASFEGNKLTIHKSGKVEISAKIKDATASVIIDTKHSKAYVFLDAIITPMWCFALLLYIVIYVISVFKKQKTYDFAPVLSGFIYILFFISFILMIIQHFI